MTWLLRICSSLLLAGSLIAGTVSGTVRLRDSSLAAVRKKMDFSGVVVWLETPNAAVRNAIAPQRGRMVQKDKTFTPHVLAIPVGSTVDFPNFDPIFHNAFSTYDGQIFDVGLYAPGTSRSVRFARAGIVRVFCNIHASMSAVIAVVNSSWFTVTARNGTFEIPNVPPGDYTLHFFHERATAATLESLVRTVQVPSGPLATGVTDVSESGYLPIPHKNKYGHDYPPAADYPVRQ